MRLYNIYFSPTGGTKKVADILSNAWNTQVKNIDILNPLIMDISLNADDICIVSVPSFGGRVPKSALERFKKISANGAKAVLVSVFGNRAIDDTLVELYDFLTANGFSCAAGIEAIAEHSLARQYATGRPDKSDEDVLTDFVCKIKEHIENGCHSETKLPGNHEYKDYSKILLKPLANSNCDSCGLCASECPVNAIPKENPTLLDADVCISCMHCITICPNNGRGVDSSIAAAVGEKLKKVCSDRKENKLYLI